MHTGTRKKDELVVYVIGSKGGKEGVEILRTYPKGDYEFDIEVGGMILGKPLSKRLFQGRLHLGMNGHIVVNKR